MNLILTRIPGIENSRYALMHGSRFPCCVSHICSFDIWYLSWNTDKYLYKSIEIESVYYDDDEVISRDDDNIGSSIWLKTKLDMVQHSPSLPSIIKEILHQTIYFAWNLLFWVDIWWGIGHLAQETPKIDLHRPKNRTQCLEGQHHRVLRGVGAGTLMHGTRIHPKSESPWSPDSAGNL